MYFEFHKFLDRVQYRKVLHICFTLIHIEKYFSHMINIDIELISVTESLSSKCKRI